MEIWSYLVAFSVLELQLKTRQKLCVWGGLPRWLSGKESVCQCRRNKTQFPSLGQEDPLETGMTTHSSILAWEIPWTEEPGGLQSKGVAKSWTH